MSWDIVTLGEPLVRFSPAASRRFDQAQGWELYAGGSELNTAVGLGRLGARVCYLARLTDNALGRFLERTLLQYGIDTSHIVWTPEDRVGLYFLEEGVGVRSSVVLYDRAGSAASRMTPDDLDTSLFQPGTARLLHLTGITPALSASCVATTLRAAQLARDAGWQVSFDVNYRSKLWGYAEAAAGCEPLLQLADIIFVPIRDAVALWPGGDEQQPLACLASLSERYPQAWIIMTLGAEGALAGKHGHSPLQQPAFRTEGGQRVGGGDAFSTGFLYAYLMVEEQTRVARALEWAAAAAALKYTIPGDLPLFTRQEVEALIRSTPGSSNIQR